MGVRSVAPARSLVRIFGAVTRGVGVKAAVSATRAAMHVTRMALQRHAANECSYVALRERSVAASRRVAWPASTLLNMV